MTTLKKIILEKAIRDLRKELTESTFEEAFQKVKEDYNLTKDEEDFIDSQIKDVESEDSLKITNDEIALVVKQHHPTIYFSCEEELDDAIGRLMFNRVAWVAQGTKDNRFCIEFPDIRTINQAIKILQKYRFVKDGFKQEANICFDNLDDYNKVLDFMRKSDMLIQNDNDDLPEESDCCYDAKSKQNTENLSTTVIVRKVY